MSEEGNFFKKNFSILEKVEEKLARRLKEVEEEGRIEVVNLRVGLKVARVKDCLGQLHASPRSAYLSYLARARETDLIFAPCLGHLKKENQSCCQKLVQLWSSHEFSRTTDYTKK